MKAVWAALRDGDATLARSVLAEISAGHITAEILEAQARADFLDREYADTVEHWELAYAAYRNEGDGIGAIRVARSLACIHGTIYGDFALMRGWIARAQTLLGTNPDDRQRGWVALNLGMFQNERALREQYFAEAISSARRVSDADLELVAMAYMGASMVHEDRIEEGMVLLDEALAAVAGREVDDFLCLEEIFCQLFSACEFAHDVGRADQWMRVGAVIAARRNLPAVSAFCRTHYGGLLTAAGRWTEANEALTEAIRQWGLGQRSALRIGAIARLADLRVRQGRLEEANELLIDETIRGASESAQPLAALHLARGEPALARDVLTAALTHVDDTSIAAAPLLSLLIDVVLALGEVEATSAIVDSMVAVLARHPDHSHVMAMVALARGRVCLATNSGDARACLREAMTAFARAGLPMEAASTRLALAQVLVEADPEAAMTEARAALDVFQRLEAARFVDAASALLRSMGVRLGSARSGTSVLSKRELEVLDLLGRGLSNIEIAERLYISRKTVEHHVGHILSKLGLRSRAEAAAYVARQEPASQ